MLRSENSLADPGEYQETATSRGLRASPVASPHAPPPAAVTPLMARVEQAIAKIARQHRPMPSFGDLAEQSGAQGRQSANKAFASLVSGGRLAIEDRPGERRVEITASGHTTAWGKHAASHAPFSAAKDKPPPKPRETRPDYQPDGVTGFRYRTEVQPLVATWPTKTCQFPLWGLGERPTHRYCDAATFPGTSWCVGCLKTVAPTHPAVVGSAAK